MNSFPADMIKQHSYILYTSENLLEMESCHNKKSQKSYNFAVSCKFQKSFLIYWGNCLHKNKTYHLFSHPHFNLVNLFIKLQNISCFFQALSSVSRGFQKVIPLLCESGNTLFDITRCRVPSLEKELSNLRGLNGTKVIYELIHHLTDRALHNDM